MNLCDQEKEVCPYDKSHFILKSRMLTHLAKCSKNFIDADKEACVFNKLHIVPRAKMKHHLATCPDKIKLDFLTNKIGDDVCPVRSVPISIDVPSTGEDWDSEPVMTHSVLDRIKENVYNKPIYRHNAVIGCSKSKRKQIRIEGILHFENSEENERHRPMTVRYQNKPVKEVIYPELRKPNTSRKISKDLENLIRRTDQSSSNSNAGKKNKNMSLSDDSAMEYVNNLSEDLQKKASVSSCSNLSELREPGSNSNSYASYLAKCQRKKLSKNLERKKLSKNLESQEQMEVLTSEIFKNRFLLHGRGKPSEHPDNIIDSASPSNVNLSTPTSFDTSSKSDTTSQKSFSDNFPTDKYGFLLMPVPGKGRGRSILHN